MSFKSTTHEWVPKGWGGEHIIVNKSEYCGKKMYFVKGKQCSLHYHQKKDETFFVIKGAVMMYYTSLGNALEQQAFQNLDAWEKWCDSEILIPGDSFYVPVGLVHRVVALEDSEVIEFSTESRDSDSSRLLKGD